MPEDNRAAGNSGLTGHHAGGHDGGHSAHVESGDHDVEGGGEGGPVEPPLFCNPLTGSQADEHPGHGQHDGSGEEEDAQQVRHPPALLLVLPLVLLLVLPHVLLLFILLIIFLVLLFVLLLDEEGGPQQVHCFLVLLVICTLFERSVNNTLYHITLDPKDVMPANSVNLYHVKFTL